MREYRDGSRSLGVPAKFVAQVRQADAVDEVTLSSDCVEQTFCGGELGDG